MLQQEKAPNQAVLTALQTATNYIFDVDGTLAERQQSIPASLASALSRTGKTNGIATSRAIDELDEVFSGTGFTRAGLMTGPVVLEDGGLVLLGGQSAPRLMVTADQQIAVGKLMGHIRANITTVPGELKWGQLGEIDFPLVHVPSYYDYRTSGSVWQQVVDGVPRELERTMEWCQRAVAELGIPGVVQLTEIGDGTLRVSVPGRSKGVALRELHEDGVLDLSRAVYFCDGRNDLPAAEEMKAKGGCVVVVDNRCPELMALADFIPSMKGPRAIERLLQLAGVC